MLTATELRHNGPYQIPDNLLIIWKEHMQYAYNMLIDENLLYSLEEVITGQCL